MIKSREKRRYFGIHLDLHPGETDTELGRRVSVERIRKFLEVVRPDFVQYDCKGHAGVLGYPNSKVSLSAPGIINDSLAIYRSVTREKDIDLWVHFSGIWDSQAMKDHPEWGVTIPDGTRQAHSASLWSNYVTERMIPQMKEVIDRYDVDGFWVDGDCWAVWYDYGPESRALFTQLTGQVDPPAKPGEPNWLAWGNLQRAKFLEYVSTYSRAVRTHRSGVGIISNWLFAPHCPEPVNDSVDYISGDLAHSDSVNQARFCGRVMDGAGLPWDLMSWGHTGAGDLYPMQKPVIQLEQEAASVIALGGGFQIYVNPTRDGAISDAQTRTLSRVGEFCRVRRELCFGSTSIPQVAVLLDRTSHYTSNPHAMAFWSGEYDAMHGTLQAILDAGHSTDIVIDYCLRGHCGEYPVIVIPEATHLAPELRDELRTYVKDGGNLLILGAKATEPFADLLGIKRTNDANENRRLLLSEYGNAPVLGTNIGYRIESSSTEILATRSAKFVPDDDELPAAVYTIAGKGSIGAILASAGLTYSRVHDPVLCNLVNSMLLRMYTPIARLTEKHPIDVIVRRQHGKLCVHLVNVANAFYAAGGIPTPQNLNVATRYPAWDVIPLTETVTMQLINLPTDAICRWEPEGIDLPITRTGHLACIQIPPFRIHGVVCVDVSSPRIRAK